MTAVRSHGAGRPTSRASAATPRTPATQTRAREPDETGFVERDGVRVFWERYGDGEPTILLMPTVVRSSTRGTGRPRSPTSPATSGSITFDDRGNGRSDRPRDPCGLRRTRSSSRTLIAVMDATGVDGCRARGARRWAPAR